MYRILPSLLLLLSLLMSLVVTHAQAEAEAEVSVVRVPVALEYPLLQYLLVSQLFTQPGKSREILQDPAGCSEIRLSDPHVSPQDDRLQIVASVSARIGVALNGNCRALVDWKGRARFRGIPVVAEGGRSLHLESGQVHLVDMGGNPLLSGPLWNLANDRLQVFFSRYTFDFSPQLQNLQQLLPGILPRHNVEQIDATIESLQVAGLQLSGESLNAEVQFEVETIAPEPPAAALTAQEVEEFEQRWQMMDALLVGAVKRYASAAHLQPLRNELLEILIDSRYRMLEALSEPADASGDAVRHWFVESWQRLNPVARRIALQDEQLHWLWLSAFTATDALYVIDQLGPGLGLEISSDGLRRLARIINAEAGDELLRYDEDIDIQLQQLWRDQQGSALPEQSSWRLRFSLFPVAQAVTSRDRLNSWAPGKHELDEYLPLIESLLTETSTRLGRTRLQNEQQTLFNKLILATAWQESCWRQFVVLKQRLEPLRSDSGDVGLMQVNEYVWRGIYDRHKLRWDIDYNIDAGTEIMLNYMVGYALKRGEHRQPGGMANLARASYSAYNGGPAQVQRYRNSKAPAAQRKADQLFWDKYQQVEAGKQMNVAACLGRDPGSLRLAARVTAPAATPLRDESWVRAQPAANFTLQLASFSTRKAAQDFVGEQKLTEAHIKQLRSAGRTLFVVLYGSFTMQSSAAPAQQKFSRLKPWLRQFRDLH